MNIQKFIDDHIGNDKLKHFLVGGGIGVFLGLIAGEYFGTITVFNVEAAAITALLGSTVAGIGKEFYDERQGGDRDGMDIVATILGGLVAAAAYWILG